MIQGGPQIELWSVLWAILFLGLPTLVVPVAAGITWGYRSGWIWGVLGSLIALVIGVGEIALYAAWLLGFRRHSIFDDPFTALEAFGVLAALLVIQIIMVLGVLSLVSRR